MVVTAVSAVEPAADRKQPNIVVYMIDDLGWNQVSAAKATMGTDSGEFLTPHLEKLASGGLSFTHAYMQPNCAPTRAALLSGQYPARVHNDVYVVGNLNRHKAPGITREQARFLGPEQSEDIAPDAVTIAEAMRENGYVTAHVGKYHVGGHGDDEATLPENQGFDINIGGCSQGHQPVCFAKQNQGTWSFPGLARGDLDRFGAPYTEAYVQRHGIPTSQVGAPKHVCDALADAMEETVGKLHATGKPFYLQLHAYAVHGPVISRPDLKAAALERLQGKQKGKAELAGFIAGMDHTLGRLVAAIEDPNGDGDTADSLADNTLILFTSDNGGTHGDNLPLRGEKGTFTEGGIRVPLIVSWPGVIPADTVTDRMVHGIDLYPTCLELAGNAWRPDENAHPLDGESFAQTLRQPDSQLKRGPIFYLFPGYMDIRAQPCVAVIDEVAGKRYKLLYFYEADAWELYNLSEDVAEQENLVDKKPQLASRLSKKIRSWLTQQHPTWQPKYPLEKASGASAGPPPVL
jgi:arylsulfatase A-like enzyme